jgi:hypothetical protein
VLFFGTPHSGANSVELAQWAARVLSVFMPVSQKVISALHRDSPELEIIQHDYLQTSKDIITVFFYEEYPTRIFNGYTELVSSLPHS